MQHAINNSCSLRGCAHVCAHWMHNRPHAKVCGTDGWRIEVFSLKQFKVIKLCFKCVLWFPAQQFYRLAFTFQFRKQLCSYPTAVLMLLYSDKGRLQVSASRSCGNICWWGIDCTFYLPSGCSCFDTDWIRSVLTAGWFCSETYKTLWLSVCPHSPDSSWQPTIELHDVICRLPLPERDRVPTWIAISVSQWMHPSSTAMLQEGEVSRATHANVCPQCCANVHNFMEVKKKKKHVGG